MLAAAREKLKADLVQEEGRVAHMYLDTQGYVTVGVGHLLAAVGDAQALAFCDWETGNPASAQTIAAEFAAIKAMPKAKRPGFYGKQAKLILPDEVIDELLDADIAAKESELRAAHACRDFDAFPAQAQQALLDMAFNLGTRKLTTQFKKLMANVEQRDWAGCAAECTVRNVQQSRNESRQALFEAAALSCQQAPAASGARAERSRSDTLMSADPGQAHADTLLSAVGSVAQDNTRSLTMPKKMPRVRRMLAHVAPKLAAALMPGNPLAGAAGKWIAGKLGKDLPEGVGKDAVGGKHLDSFLEDLAGNVEGLQKIKELEHQFELEMDKLDVNVFELEVDDRKSARELAQKDIRPQLYLSIAFVIAYFLILGGVIYAEISPNFNPGAAWVPADSACADAAVQAGTPLGDCAGGWQEQGESLLDVIQVLLGVLTAGVAQVLNFWFGGLMRRNQPST